MSQQMVVVENEVVEGARSPSVDCHTGSVTLRTSLEKIHGFGLLVEYAYWLRELKRIPAKHLRKAWVAPVAKENLASVAAKLSATLVANSFLPYTAPSAYELTLAKIVARQESKAALRAPSRAVESIVKRGGQRSQLPVALYSDWLEMYDSILSQLPDGGKFETRKSIVRCNQDRSMSVTYKDTGLTKTLMRTLSFQRGCVVATVEVKYSRPVRFTTRQGEVVYGDVEREQTFIPSTSLAKRPPEYAAYASSLDAQLQEAEAEFEKEKPDSLPSLLEKPRQSQSGLSAKMWYDFLAGFVRVDLLSPVNDRMQIKVRGRPLQNGSPVTFSIGNKTYAIEDYRFRSVDARDFGKYLSLRGHLADSLLWAVAGKLAFLQRLKGKSFGAILDETLPWLLANLDTFGEATLAAPPYTRTTVTLRAPTAPALIVTSTPSTRSPTAQRLRNQVLEETVA